MNTSQFTPTILLTDINRKKKEWRALHANAMGSNDTAIAAGLSPYVTPNQLYLIKSGLQPEPKMTEPMEVGIVLEGPITHLFQKRTGIKCERNRTMYGHPEQVFSVATPDNWACVENKDGCVEIKNVGQYGVKHWSDGVPEGIQVQAHKQMAVTGAAFVIVVGLLGGNRLHHERIERDEEMCRLVLQIDREFWANIENGTPPNMQAADSAALSSMYKLSTPQTLSLDARYEAICARWLEAREAAKNAEEMQDVCAAELKTLMREYEAATCGNFKIRWKTQGQTRLDTKALKAERPDIYAQYGRDTTTRPFQVVAVTK